MNLSIFITLTAIILVIILNFIYSSNALGIGITAGLLISAIINVYIDEL